MEFSIFSPRIDNQVNTFELQASGLNCFHRQVGQTVGADFINLMYSVSCHLQSVFQIQAGTKFYRKWIQYPISKRHRKGFALSL